MPKRKSKSQLTPRSPGEVAGRVIGLIIAVGRVYDPENCVEWMTGYDLAKFLTPAEAAFVASRKPKERERVAFSWRAGAMVSLLWGLHGLPEMPPLDEKADVFKTEMVQSVMEDPAAFLSEARLRDAAEISEMESCLHHQHWRVRDAEFVGLGRFLDPQPGDPLLEKLHPGIVYERRYGLSWLVGWGEDWDHVPTDT